MIRQVLLDLDGTLTDPGLGIARCIVHALDRLGRAAPNPADLRHWVGPPLADSFRAFLGAGHGHLVAPAIAAYRERFGAVGMFEKQVHPGVPELLAELRARGCELRVVTSSPRSSKRILRHFELAHHFAGIRGSELDGSHGDVLGARQNGVPTIGVLWGYGSRDELQQAGRARSSRPPAT